MAALAYHETVLPLGWQSIQGQKCHVTGAFRRALLEHLHPYLRAYPHVVVLGDAAYCNETVITWVRQQQSELVCHIQQASCLVRTPDDPAWQPIARVGRHQRIAGRAGAPLGAGLFHPSTPPGGFDPHTPLGPG